jgi:hypothetical protein
MRRGILQKRAQKKAKAPAPGKREMEDAAEKTVAPGGRAS